MEALLILALASVAIAAEPPAIFLSAKRLSSVKDVQNNWETSWGSYDRDFARAVAIDISLRNMRKTQETVMLEVLFVAKPVSGSARWVFDRIAEEVTLDQAKSFHVVKISKVMEASVQNYEALDMRDEAGGRIDRAGGVTSSHFTFSVVGGGGFSSKVDDGVSSTNGLG